MVDIVFDNSDSVNNINSRYEDKPTNYIEAMGAHIHIYTYCIITILTTLLFPSLILQEIELI